MYVGQREKAETSNLVMIACQVRLVCIEAYMQIRSFSKNVMIVFIR